MYFKAYLQTLFNIIGKSKEISKDLRKKLWTTTSLVHPWEQFQIPEGITFICTSINTMGPCSFHTAQEGDAFCLR